jgi:[acyl-carrier-protein] S-malonyltransferase
MTALDGKKIAFVFPGQGSQKVGMGRAWADLSAAARRTFEEADDALGFPLSKLCWEGPEDELGLTVNTQPALLTVSTAIHRALAEGAVPGTETLQPLVMAGHSLGEYSALVAAGALDLGEALRLVRRRGQLMQEAVPVGVGAMAAVIGLDTEGVTALAADAAAAASMGSICAVANLNGPGQTVIAGHKAAVDRAVAMAKDRGARKATLLAVSAPFHSPLMRPAREGMEKELARATFRDPRPPVVTNVDAAPVTAGDAAREALVRQIDSPVRWVETVQRMVADFGVDTFLEVGPGTVLCGLNRRIAQGTMSASLADPEQVRKLLSGDEGEGAKAESSASS